MSYTPKIFSLPDNDWPQLRRILARLFRKISEMSIPSGSTVAFSCKVGKDGGSAGDEDNTCTFTYTVKTLTGDELGTEISPQKKRVEKCIYNQPGNDSYGLACYDGETLVLLEAFEEYPDSKVCS